MGLLLHSVESHFVTYLISHSWHGSITTATADPPIQNNKSVKAPFTCDVQKNTVLRVGSRVKYSTRLHLMLYLSLDPTPHTVFSVHHS